MLLAFPWRKNSQQLLLAPKWLLSSACTHLDSPMKCNSPRQAPACLTFGPQMPTSLWRKSQLCLSRWLMQPLKGKKKKKAYSNYDFAMAPTKSLKDFRCIWKLNSVGPPEPASLLNTRGTDNDKTQTRVLMQAWWYLGCPVMTRHKQSLCHCLHVKKWHLIQLLLTQAHWQVAPKPPPPLLKWIFGKLTLNTEHGIF